MRFTRDIGVESVVKRQRNIRIDDGKDRWGNDTKKISFEAMVVGSLRPGERVLVKLAVGQQGDDAGIATVERLS